MCIACPVSSGNGLHPAYQVVAITNSESLGRSVGPKRIVLKSYDIPELCIQSSISEFDHTYRGFAGKS
jgi:hypothetical protein